MGCRPFGRHPLRRFRVLRLFEGEGYHTAALPGEELENEGHGWVTGRDTVEEAT
jgi:hypothetical protein